MKDTHVDFWKLTAMLAIVFSASAHAEPNSGQSSGRASTDAKADLHQRVQIMPDQERGEVRFIIDGRPVLRVTSESIIVSGSVIYTGVVNDIGNGN